MVADDAIPEAGRKVRCGGCSHTWHQEPLPAEVKEEIEDAKNSQAENLKQAVADKASGVEPKLPVVFKSRPAPLAMKIAVAAMLLLNIFGFVIFNKKTIGIEGLYSLIGQQSTDGIVIEKVVMLDPFISGEDITHYVDWKIKNTLEKPIAVPKARITLLDEDKHVLLQSAGQRDAEIAAGESFRFKANKIEDIGAKGRYLLIEIGNSMELSSR